MLAGVIEPEALSDTARTVPDLALPVDGAACLVLIYPPGPNMGRRFPLDAALSLGREPSNDVSLRDPGISRRHAQVERTTAGYRVLDLGSTNGTYVNNLRVARHDIADGDYLRLGSCIFRFLAGGNIEAQYHQEIYRLSVIDALTGIANRRALEEWLQRELSQPRSLGLVLLDIDHFKQINDRLGHLAGDMTLQQLARRLKAGTRKQDLLARYGGEEFVVCLADATREHTHEAAQRLCAAIAAEPFQYDGQTYPVTISVGVSHRAAAQPVLGARELLRQADSKLYLAKARGRNCVVA